MNHCCANTCRAFIEKTLRCREFTSFYTYDGEEGSRRRENIPLSTLVRFQNHYGDEAITKWDIFHYVYAVLHHPEYRTRYAANLRRELPRIPLVELSLDRIEGIQRMAGIKSSKSAKPPPVNLENPANPVLKKDDAFRTYVAIGRQLADLHVHYEQAAEYPLQRIEAADEPLNWRVEKMRLTKDKTALVYNNFLTLAGIPEATFAYRLGNRSVLEWVIGQYQPTPTPAAASPTIPTAKRNRTTS